MKTELPIAHSREDKNDVKNLLADEFGERIPGDDPYLDDHHTTYIRTCSLSPLGDREELGADVFSVERCRRSDRLCGHRR